MLLVTAAQGISEFSLISLDDINFSGCIAAIARHTPHLETQG